MFIQNKYTVWYDRIIHNVQLQNRTRLKKGHPEYVYYERHHILPKSMGGTDDKINLVLLTPKEHFICHLLLTKMCINQDHAQKMRFALKMIMGSKMTVASSTIYAKIREEIATTLGNLHRGKPKSASQIAKMVHTRREHGNYKHSHETRIKIGMSSKNRTQSSETKQKRSAALKGKSHGSKYWVNDGVTVQRVSEEKLTELLNQGWAKGRLALKQNQHQIIYRISEQGKEVKYVEDPAPYLESGWCMGRGPHTKDHCNNISKVRLGKPKTDSHKQRLSQSVKKAWSEGRHRPL